VQRGGGGEERESERERDRERERKRETKRERGSVSYVHFVSGRTYSTRSTVAAVSSLCVYATRIARAHAHNDAGLPGLRDEPESLPD
jgi:hypothetical protein